jgi:hypothetical protein
VAEAGAPIGTSVIANNVAGKEVVMVLNISGIITYYAGGGGGGAIYWNVELLD